MQTICNTRVIILSFFILLWRMRISTKRWLFFFSNYNNVLYIFCICWWRNSNHSFRRGFPKPYANCSNRSAAVSKFSPGFVSIADCNYGDGKCFTKKSCFRNNTRWFIHLPATENKSVNERGNTNKNVYTKLMVYIREHVMNVCYNTMALKSAE